MLATAGNRLFYYTWLKMPTSSPEVGVITIDSLMIKA